MKCLKCGTDLKRKTQAHDCKGIRERAARGVSADVDRRRQENEQALRSMGCKFINPPGARGGGLPGSSQVE